MNPLRADAGPETDSTWRVRALWLALATVTAFCAVALAPPADPESLGGVPAVSAASSPSPLWRAARGTQALDTIKAKAKKGTPAEEGPSANVGQTLKMKGPGMAPGVASFEGYNGEPVTGPLYKVKTGKKAKVDVPPLAVTGDVAVLPDGSEATNPLHLQIVPEIVGISTKLVEPDETLTIDGTGFAPGSVVVFPGVAAPVAPAELAEDHIAVIVPEGVQKGKLVVRTDGGTSNTAKVKPPKNRALANRSLATDPGSGLILATDDEEWTLSAIDPATGAVVRVLRLESEPARVSVAPGSRVAVVEADEDGAVAFVDLERWTVMRGDGAAKRYVARAGEVAVSASREAVAGDDGMVRVGPALEVAKWAPDGRRVVALSGDAGVLYVVDPVTKTVVWSYGFGAPVEGLTFGLDGLAYTIDRRTGRLLAVAIE